jgi:hemin uptake protein HemP
MIRCEEPVMPEPEKPAAPPDRPDETLAPVVSTRELFQGRREVCIEHEGVRYRLRITRRNKLILQK